MTLSTEAWKKLAALDTPTVCNLIELFGVRPQNTGYMDGRIRAAFPDFPPMVGYAVTASFRADAPAHGAEVYAAIDAQLEQMAQLDGPAAIVFQDLDDPSVAATFGEVMCSSYQCFNASGLITSGTGRDLEQVRGLSFPVFTNGTICSHGYCHLLHVGQSVRVGGLVVRPGDLLHGDANGVTNVPLDVASELADAGEEFLAAEAHVIEYARGEGAKSIAEFKRRMEATKADIEKLRVRLSRV